MEEGQRTGFIRKLNFKRTWGVIADEQENEYYFETADMDRDPFSIREGLAVSFQVVPEIHAETHTDRRAISVSLLK